MTPEEVKQFTRHWVEVYVDDGPQPTYRGLFLPGDGVTFAVNGHLEADDALPSSRGDRPLVSAIKRIVALQDPDWLVDANRAATVVAARAELLRAGRAVDADSN